MPFRETVKTEARRRADFRCVICHELWVEVHHIVPQADGGGDEIENAAPLCGSCHNAYGGNPDLRNRLREMRDDWWDRCARAQDVGGQKDLARRMDEIHAAVQAGLRSQEQGLEEVKQLLVADLESAKHPIRTSRSLSDLISRASTAQQMESARLSGISTSFKAQEVPWARLLAESKRLCMLVAYARTWRMMLHSELHRFVSRKKAALEIVLPDVSVPTISRELGARFEMSDAEIGERVGEAEEFFRELGRAAAGVVRVYRMHRTPLFTLYRFDKRAVFASYRHGTARRAVLTMMADRGGSVYEWLEREWDDIVSTTGLSTLVYDSAE